MKIRRVILYWSVLICAAGLVAALLAMLLRHEQDRLDMAARRAAEEQARLIAERIELTVRDVEDILLNRLVSIPAEEVVPTLELWVRENPLVRGVFAMDSEGRMILPDPAGALTREERSFLRRIEPLQEDGNLLALPTETVSEEVRLARRRTMGGEENWQQDVLAPQRQAVALARRAPERNVAAPGPARPAETLARYKGRPEVAAALPAPAAAPPAAVVVAQEKREKLEAEAPVTGWAVARDHENRAGEVALADAPVTSPPAPTASTPPPAASIAMGARMTDGFQPESLMRETSSGWSPWFAENGLNLIAWVRPARGNVALYGFELELMTLMSTLIGDLPTTLPEGLGYAIHDDNGRIIHQLGNIADLKPPRLYTLSLAPMLPHWEVALYNTGGSSAALLRHTRLLLIAAFAVVLLVAIVSGGTLLLRQAQRHYLDALRKTSFVSNVSHELKTPLTTIRLYAELLAQNRASAPEKRSRYLQVIVDEAQRLTRLVNNVLDFSRLEQNRKKYQLAPVDLSALVRDLVENQRRRIEEAGMKAELHLPGAGVTVRTDRDAVEQTLLNLLDNAIKYAAEGGEVMFELAAEAGGRPTIRVGDRGPGVPSAHREHIFEQFFRVDDSLTTRRPGTGLGLSIARRLMRDLGGNVWYESRTGGGACFVAAVGDVQGDRPLPAARQGTGG